MNKWVLSEKELQNHVLICVITDSRSQGKTTGAKSLRSKYLPRMICQNFQIPTCSMQLHSFVKQSAQGPLRTLVAMRCSAHLKIAKQCKSVSKDKSSCDSSWDGGKIPAIEPSASAASCLTIGCSFTSLSILLRVSKAALFCNCPKT